MFTKEQQKENRKKWVEALRSGKYKQIKGSLCLGSQHCCLGVMCDIAVESVEGLAKVNDDFYLNQIKVVSYITEDKLKDFVGLRTAYGCYIDDKDKNKNKSLTALNDVYDKSFNEIADIIESEPEGLFVN